ncbi:PLP-dependent aminotransferase family protein [Curtobacterium flaccumfaciens pv. flaccumfaciens]|uniref:PLP-dependent aminotransferase family protein n=1 Tax=Curtobacterium flaccumfaciens pv. flaccumfaciens TaxID=138532 RepID=A0A9Q2W651_9MICO|nr:PLP-dependent aminotransferase family protein [Curtobacterium flaccumfaciens]MBT1541695.1 PLP-dependent aminotransferase family protein [Curtobacterium flaccumfaciens pv. flaccumfaciens]MBT1617631.1 PLP-dependent aminotransferase family protein [Curtobacterium flaccumfaciens pv. poinsettiae]
MDQFGAITVDQSSKVSGVVARVRAMVHDGTLREGDPLPSTRALAAELGVARGTVVAAYEQLDGEGYLRTRHGAVARVAADVHGRTPGGSVAGGAGPGSPVAFAADAVLADPSPAVRIDCRPGIPAVTAIPQRDWRAAWRAAASAPLRNAIAEPLGSPELRAQVVAQLGLTRGFTTTVDRVLVTAGTSEALSLITEALRSLLGRPPVFGVEDPGYRTGHRAITSAGGTLVAVPVGEDGLDLDALEAAGPVDAVLVSPTHQYPLGSVMPVARRRRLLAWAAATGTVVVEDDYDSEFRHRGTPVPALAALDAEGVVLHVGGFSKTLDPRLRCAWVVLPSAAGAGIGARVAEAVLSARRARGAVVAEPVQAALAHLLRTGALRRHLGRVRRDYAHRRARIAARLDDVTGLEARALNGGLHAVVTWSGPTTGADVAERMADAGVRVATLEEYGLAPGSAPAGIVFGYGAVTLPELDRALDALVESVAHG